MSEPLTLPPGQELTALWAARLGIARPETAQPEAAEAGALYAFDAAFPAPPSVYKANGGIAANVYVSGNYAQTAAHVAALRAAGVAPWPNYERGLWELVSNRAAGQAAARIGIADALRCGFPADGSIWFPFSVDVSVDPTRYNEVAQAFLGVQDINAGRYLISFYGQGQLAQYLRRQGLINQKCWLSASSSFPGYDQASPDICMWQQVGNFIPGHSTDRNVITDVRSLPAWWPTGSPYAAAGGIFMSLSDAEQQEMHDRIMSFPVNSIINTEKAVGYARTAIGAIPTTAQVTDKFKAVTDALALLKTAVSNTPTNGELQLVIDQAVTDIKAAIAAGPGVGGGAAPSYEGAITLTPKAPT